MDKKERIGKIELNYANYPGQDFYCDGAVEDELLQIVREYEPCEYNTVIEERAEWPVFYHLSGLRGNIVEWMPMDKNAKVLEVGAGCGAVTGTLSAKAGEVTCIDLSRKRSLINAYRNKECGNVTIQVGNFRDIEPGLPDDYDYIFLIGVFEYGQSYIGGEHPYEDFLAILKRHVKPGGRIVIAIENKYGLKYWAGCREDHLGTYFSGIEDYAEGGGVRTFTKGGLERLCRSQGLTDYHFYYPYPDYKFPTCIYSGKRLPKVGELTFNLCNYDRERMLLFDEKNAFDGIVREGLFPLYANSYLLIVGPDLPVCYSKYSNDRAEEFAIRTDIMEAADGGETDYAGPAECGGAARYVCKTAMNAAAKPHIARIAGSYEALRQRYQEGGLSVNRCELSGNGASVRLEYLEGQTLEELFDICLDNGDEDGFRRLFDAYRESVAYGITEDILNYDLIFSNILIERKPGCADAVQGQWTILDYEWTGLDYSRIFGRQITPEDIILRALYCYRIGAAKRERITFGLISEITHDTEKALQRLAGQEAMFQDYVTGYRLALTDIRNQIGMPIVPVRQMLMRQAAKWERKRVQVYLDRGEGFCEEDSFYVEDAYQDRGELGEGSRFSLRLRIESGIRAVRIDPALEACILTVRRMNLGEDGAMGEKRQELNLRDKRCSVNGILLSDHTAVFATQDPNITLRLSQSSKGASRMYTLQMEADIAALPASIAENAVNARQGRWKLRLQSAGFGSRHGG